MLNLPSCGIHIFSAILIFVPLAQAENFKTLRVVPEVAPAPNGLTLTSEKIELGRELFFDTRLSSTKTISCNSCHSIVSGENKIATGTDNLPVSIGVFGSHGGRNAPTVWNTALRQSLFWDGRANSLEEQAKGPMMNPVEMGMLNSKAIEKVVQEIPEYREKFEKVFHSGKKRSLHPITIQEIAEALAAFERTLVTPDSAFDLYQKGIEKAMSEAAIRGWQKFQQHGCIACHAAPTFDGKDYFVRFPLHTLLDEDRIYNFTKDEGRFNVTHDFKDRNVWRVPSLQNVAITGPYFHNGSVDQLEKVVKIMAKAQLRKTLPEKDVQDIVEFLKSLTGKAPPISADTKQKKGSSK